jgi:16S rRNA (uracil1498-N3)-methyltransferase
MSNPRFYCPPPLPETTNFELPAEAAHHASRVLRLRVNDGVQIFDGIGNALDATINQISGKRVILGNLQTCITQPSPGLNITLAQALCTSEKMDWIVQKATELGASQILPLQAERSVAKLTAMRAEKSLKHWHSVAISACEQSGRNNFPLINAPQDIETWLLSMHNAPGSKFIFLPGGSSHLNVQPKPQLSATLLIGPEGGFSDDESNIALKMGFVPILLGPRVLRTETAAIAGISALQTLWGDFN